MHGLMNIKIYPSNAALSMCHPLGLCLFCKGTCEELPKEMRSRQVYNPIKPKANNLLLPYMGLNICYPTLMSDPYILK
jgi:hypothetical protein